MNKGVKNKQSKNRVYLSNRSEFEEVTCVLKKLEKREIKVTPILSFEKRAELVRMIAAFVFVNEGNNIEDYAPEYREFSERYNTIKYYTDFKLPEDINDAWLILNSTPLYDKVIQIIRDDIYEIYAAADDLIQSRKRYLENKTDINRLFENISNKIGSLGAQFSKEDFGAVLKLIEALPNYSSENVIQAIANINNESKK